MDVVADQRLVERRSCRCLRRICLPSGSSPFFFSGLRKRSSISRNAPLLARSPRKPSSSFNSILKLSMSTDGRRRRAVPADAGGRQCVFSHFALARRNPRVQRRGNPLVSWGANGEWRVANGPPYSPFATRHSPFSGQIPHIWPVFGPVCLDSGLSSGYKSRQPGAGFFSRCLFLRGFTGSLPDRAGIEPITTEEKAGPEQSEAGIEHEGIKRCSQSSKPAAGNTASFRMMCSR